MIHYIDQVHITHFPCGVIEHDALSKISSMLYIPKFMFVILVNGFFENSLFLFDDSDLMALEVRPRAWVLGVETGIWVGSL
jgi:hypothetical protein